MITLPFATNWTCRFNEGGVVYVKSQTDPTEVELAVRPVMNKLLEKPLTKTYNTIIT